MLKRGFTVWNVLAFILALALAFAVPGLFPSKHQNPDSTQTND
jgi:hypothetical protein